MLLLMERHSTWADAFEPAEAEGLGMPGEFRGRAGGVFEESAELSDDMQPAVRLDLEAIEDRRKVFRNRSAFVGSDLSAGPVEKLEIVVEFERKEFVVGSSPIAGSPKVHSAGQRRKPAVARSLRSFCGLLPFSDSLEDRRIL